MRWRKALLSLFLAFAVVISTVSLGWSIANNDHIDTTIYILHLSFALYVFLISARSVLQVTTNDHSNSIIHLTALLTVAFLLLGSVAILPNNPPPVTSFIDDDDPVLLSMWYALIGVYIVGCILAYSTPLGPPLHFPPSYIYSEKTVKSITNMDERNVCGTTGRQASSLHSCNHILFRCLSMGHSAFLIHHQSRLARKYRGKP